MAWLTTNHRSLPRVLAAVTKPLGAEVTGVLIKGVDHGQVTGSIRIEHRGRVLGVYVDMAGALELARHLGLPMFMDSYTRRALGTPARVLPMSLVHQSNSDGVKAVK